MKEWVTIKEGQAIIGGSLRRIYVWIDGGKLATRTNADGVTEILAKALLRVESQTKRGRPRGTPNR